MIYLNEKEAAQFHIKNTAIALGKFDGIHLGHQLLVDGLLEEKKQGRNALVFTFGFAPKEVLEGSIRRCIYTAQEKKQYFESLGMDVLLEYPFTKEFAAFTPEEFVKTCLVDALDVKAIYVGTDFHFGKNRSGNVKTLQELGEKYGFTVHAISKKNMQGEVVSSTRIRTLIEKDFEQANVLLGNPYFIFSEVVHGKHLGNTIGFPTINQVISPDKVVPAYGVYASQVTIDEKQYFAVSNLGKKPTIAGEHALGLETFIINYEGDLYGKMIKTQLRTFIRPEQKFSSVEELTEQIQKDVMQVKRLYGI
ncbi:MAG: bifunctional riboflavin kinase/FAD synthetase [Eubacteriales bacterium]|nr:bifunctional riboflavin kinase/FAD synthetase [Eubacteriales bacterium]